MRTLGRSPPGRENSRCKGPEAGGCTQRLRYNEVPSAAGIECVSPGKVGEVSPEN